MTHSSNRPKVALALGGGAARGLAHIGILKVLEKHDIPVDIIVGTSMGAMIGGAYAAGLNAGQLEEIACSTNWKRVVQILFPRKVQRGGLLDGMRIQEFLISLLGEREIEDLPLRFACVATNLWSGEEIILDSGSLVKAIRASISFPFLFQPAEIDGMYLIDGGVVNPVPVSIARSLNANIVLAVKVTPSVEHHSKRLSSGTLVTNENLSAANSSSFFLQRLFGNFSERFLEFESKKRTEKIARLSFRKQMAHVATTMENMILTLRLRETPPDVLIAPDVNDFQFFDFLRPREIIKQGEVAGEEAIPLIQKLLIQSDSVSETPR